MLPHEYLLRRRVWAGAGLAIIVALASGASWLTDFDPGRALQAFPEAASWAVANFVPDAAAWKRLPKILDKLNETILMAVSSSTVAAVFALVFAIAGDAARPWEHVRLLARLSRISVDEAARRRLRSAPDDAALLAALRQEDASHE